MSINSDRPDSDGPARYDVVIPDNNEQEFIATALELGYEEIVFLTKNINYIKPTSDSIKVKTAYLIHDVSQIQKARNRFDYVFAFAERKFFESKADFIVGSELSERKDSFHFKSTRLNQVHAELAKANAISIVFDLNSLISAPMFIMGKFYQNALLVKKYDLSRQVFSMAKTPADMRSNEIRGALLNVLRL